MSRWGLVPKTSFAGLLLVALGCTPAPPAPPPTPPEPMAPAAAPVPADEDPTIPLALTLDDLPYVGATVRGLEHGPALAQIVTTLQAERVPATGFVTCGRLGDGAALQPWLEAGLPVANHSTAHRSVDDLGREAFVADVRACRDRLTALTGETPRYFRYPMLMTGAERGLRDAVAADIAALGHRRAPVTIDISDWALTSAYAEAVEQKDEDRAEAIAEAYVSHVRRSARRYRALARRRRDREVAQVLLLHANNLASDQLGRIVAMLREEGFRFVSLDEAMRDPIYDEPDDWVDPVGASWLLRLAPAQPAEWGWDRGQRRAMQLRFGTKTDEVAEERIGPHLRAQRLPGVPAWRIVHREAVAANALVHRMPSGATVLADTPWTPRATHDLLDWIEARFGAPPALATVSHFHLDAAGGITALQERGIPLWASDRTAALVKERGERMRASLAESYGAIFEGWSVGLPTKTFPLATGHRATVGGGEVVILHPGAGHAPDNVVTWFPQSKVMFGGCMVKGGKDLGYLGDANRDTWPGAMQRLQALEPAVVVPGHGARTDPELLAHTAQLLADGAPGVD